MPVPASAPEGTPKMPLPQLFPPSERTVPRMLQLQAERHGQRRLVALGGITLTYDEAADAAAGHAAALAAAGIQPGDRVAIMCGNRAELLLTILGCAWRGAIAVPINVASRGAQLEHILSNCGARLLVIERELAPVLASLDRGRFPLEALWLVGEGNDGALDGFRCLPFPPPQKGLPPHPVEPSDTFAITGSITPPPLTLTLDDLRNSAIANRPDLKAAQAQVDVNVAAVKLAKANGTADPTIEAEYERSGNANTVGGNLNIPLRIFDRNQGEKERAAYELESSRLAYTAARNQVLSDVDSAWAGYQTAASDEARYRDKYLAEAAHVRDNLEFSYRNGNSTLLDYLSALSDYRQVNLASLNAKLQLLISLEQLAYATQTEIAP